MRTPRERFTAAGSPPGTSRTGREASSTLNKAPLELIERRLREGASIEISGMGSFES